MNLRNKAVWGISIFFTVLVIAFSVRMLWLGTAGPIKPLEELNRDWPQGVNYEIFVRSFYDSNGDGIGDLNGVTEKLDYLKDLGVEGIWLMPIQPSPSYHGYDVTDYYGINPDYGTVEDFKRLITEAHKRNIRVIIDLVLNHTSKEHPWFQKALAGDPKYRNWYIWAKEGDEPIGWDSLGSSPWHGSGNNRYYGLFWEGMPDLNYDNPEVRQEAIKIGQYWLKEMGVDGFRLDAAKYIYPTKEKEKNYTWWQEFRQAMDQVNPNFFMVGEVWDSPSVIGPYLKGGLHSAFNFDLSAKILASAKGEEDAGIGAYLTRVRDFYKKMDQNAIDSIFITNHDMNRTMSELNGNLNQAKMAASLLLTLPGAPFLYYGEEIGMEGKKPDESIREPMRWFKEAGKPGETTWERPIYNGPNSPSVEEEMEDQASLYRHYKTFIYLRRSLEPLAKGEIEESMIRQKGIVAFKRVLENESILVIHNMTRNPIQVSIPEKEADFGKVLYANHPDNRIKREKGGLTLTTAPYTTTLLAK
ncbi:alpha-amylase family glycosyl hydrolase [Thermicanus aegyptius]|uniref:alpha-amylase family glycosyl hydrolase n=1 Tax=Thermicanus aegyptius TaxID=94009 RepID=UPI0005874D3F|nr:alpha-amylase family glycosyl hydrolase [Thermicanus aegyptius]